MAGPPKHISSSFDASLYGLRNDVLMMSSLADRLFRLAFEALLNRDSELCDHIIAEDQQIDLLEKQIDQDGERIGDESVTIALRARRLDARGLVPEVALLEPAYELALAIFRDSMRAFAERDFELARTVKPRDKQLDALTTELTEKFVARTAANPDLVATYLDLIFVGRALERIGDHATNIAEDAFWRDQGADIRHTYGAARSLAL